MSSEPEDWTDPDAKEYDEKKERRERIATAALQGILAYAGPYGGDMLNASLAIKQADALIKALDQEEGK